MPVVEIVGIFPVDVDPVEAMLTNKTHNRADEHGTVGLGLGHVLEEPSAETPAPNRQQRLQLRVLLLESIHPRVHTRSCARPSIGKVCRVECPQNILLYYKVILHLQLELLRPLCLSPLSNRAPVELLKCLQVEHHGLFHATHSNYYFQYRSTYVQYKKPSNAL